MCPWKNPCAIFYPISWYLILDGITPAFSSSFSFRLISTARQYTQCYPPPTSGIRADIISCTGYDQLCWDIITRTRVIIHAVWRYAFRDIIFSLAVGTPRYAHLIPAMRNVLLDCMPPTVFRFVTAYVFHLVDLLFLPSWSFNGDSWLSFRPSPISQFSWVGT